MLLEGKVAVIYGGGGSIGGAVATAFARVGATVHLAGRTPQRLEAVAARIRQPGGSVQAAQLDALDERAVDEHAAAVAAGSGRLDISLNVIQHSDVQGTPMTDMNVEDYLQPVATAVRTTFLTARAAARLMRKQGSGVILMFGGYGDPPREHYLGGLQTAFQAIESMRRQLAAELGRHGVRVLSIQTGGVPESIPQESEWRDAIAGEIAGRTLLGRAATLDDVGNVAAFAASDCARSMTATALNITCGAVIG